MLCDGYFYFDFGNESMQTLIFVCSMQVITRYRKKSTCPGGNYVTTLVYVERIVPTRECVWGLFCGSYQYDNFCPHVQLHVEKQDIIQKEPLPSEHHKQNYQMISEELKLTSYICRYEIAYFSHCHTITIQSVNYCVSCRKIPKYYCKYFKMS